jgi:hypothetical protein
MAVAFSNFTFQVATNFGSGLIDGKKPVNTFDIDPITADGRTGLLEQ